MTELQEFDVVAHTPGGGVNYRVTARHGDEAVFKVVTLCNALRMPLEGGVELLKD